MADSGESARHSVLTLFRKRWRVWLRAAHRDVGYLIVGLTVVYALSGLAINHIDDWNSNYRVVERTVTLEAPLPAESGQAAAAALTALGIEEQPDDVFEAAGEIEISLGDNHRVSVDRATRQATQDYQKPRFFLAAINWLHYSRGKAAWTYIADGYAILLLAIAVSGVFMLKGKKGLVGRGLVLVTLGALIPVVYLQLSGGP